MSEANKGRWLELALLGLAAGLTLAGPAQAQTAAVSKEPGKPAQLREPEIEERKLISDAAAKLLNRTASGLVRYVLDDGSSVVNLHGRFQSLTLATVQPDGSVSTGCVTTTEEARQWLDKATAKEPRTPAVRPASPLEEK